MGAIAGHGEGGSRTAPTAMIGRCNIAYRTIRRTQTQNRAALWLCGSMAIRPDMLSVKGPVFRGRGAERLKGPSNGSVVRAHRRNSSV